jgi:hypothetical protein
MKHILYHNHYKPRHRYSCIGYLSIGFSYHLIGRLWPPLLRSHNWSSSGTIFAIIILPHTILINYQLRTFRTLSKVLYANQARQNTLKITFNELEKTSWDTIYNNILYLHYTDRKRQIRVYLLYYYNLKTLEVTDSILNNILVIKRGGEGIIILRKSPVKKKGKS